MFTLDNPFTGDTACSIELAQGDAVSQVLDRAKKAARAFADSKIAERVALCERAISEMEKRETEIAADISRMMGKPVQQAKNEVKGMVGRARHMQEIAAASLADIVLPAKEGF